MASGGWARLYRAAMGFVLLAASALAVAAPADVVGRIAEGIALRSEGLIDRAIAHFETIRADLEPSTARTRATGELGITLLQARRLNTAADFLDQAYRQSTGADRARLAVHLGNLELIRKQPARARALYQEALDLQPQDARLQAMVGLNLVRLAPPAQRLAQLTAMSRQLDAMPSVAGSAALHLNLGEQARQTAPEGTEIAYRHLARAAELARAAADVRLQIQANDVLAQLYEDRGRPSDAQSLNQRGIELAAGARESQSADLLVNLHWRQGRLHRAAGQPAQALAAYQRAVALIESIRQDIPIFYEDGRSSFASTLEPVYTGFADLVLQQLAAQPATARNAQLRAVVQAIESMRQSEIQDFLGDRCTVEAVQGAAGSTLAAGTAVLYPIVLPDRLELLLVTPEGIQRRTSRASAKEVKESADELARLLREGLEGYLRPARELHEWLLKPFDAELKAKGFDTLVVAPGGVLRLVPMGVLHDGEKFAIERFAVSVVSGMSMTNMSPRPGRKIEALVAGVSDPGPVVTKLDQAMMAAVADAGDGAADTRGLAGTRKTRAVRSSREVRNGAEAPSAGAASLEELRKRFALPGVREEVDALRLILAGTNILNKDFTVGHFSEEAESGRYRIVHIATHGFFGGNAESSFIMAYDDLLTINGLQALLKSESFEKNPIELLSLSACQTAQGNDRAPLGISGAAIKARAKSVVGTLWPVDDDAAKTLMTSLYTRMTRDGLSKTAALREAQLELLRTNRSQAPFFWAPFVLIGNWL